MKTKLVLLLVLIISISFFLTAGAKKPATDGSNPLSHVKLNDAQVPDTALSTEKAEESRKVDEGTHQSVLYLIPIILGAIWGLLKLNTNSIYYKLLVQALSTIWDIWCKTDNKYAKKDGGLVPATREVRYQETLLEVNKALPKTQKTLLEKIFGSVSSAIEFVGNTLGKGILLKNAIKSLKW
jgi:hypothetical protein